MTSKNILKTMAAITLGQVMAEKIGFDDEFFDLAYNAWRYYPTQADIDIVYGWLNRFEEKIWHGAEQEAHTNLSFAIVILERQAGYLRGAKLKVIDSIIKLLQTAYEALERPDTDEYGCLLDAEKAFNIWKLVINDIPV